jgi:hypothetical protein
MESITELYARYTRASNDAAAALSKSCGSKEHGACACKHQTDGKE